MSENIEIERLEACIDSNGNKVLQGRIATFNAHIIHKKDWLIGCSLFDKNNRQWINFPGFKYEKKSGETIYEECYRKDTETLTRALKNEILKVVLEARQLNPSMEPESVTGPCDGDDAPF